MLKKLFLAAALCAATSAQAQIKAEHPRFCVMSVGPTQMMFSAFQENRSDEIYCQHIAAAGPTMIILDAKSNELRDMNVEVRLIKNVGQKDWRDDLDATTVAAIPAKKYLADRGTTSFTHDFKGDGDYIAIVRATSDDGAKEYVGEYQFTVGSSYEEALMTGALASLLGFAGFLMWRRGTGATKSASPEGQAKPEGSAARHSTM
ncbi:hypothetical protein [Methylocystis parvus]|uniref:hypothetical protein n=1 Tax=Methylocystis parvus TaxID=134 RepID=UPI003C75AAEB